MHARDRTVLIRSWRGLVLRVRVRHSTGLYHNSDLRTGFVGTWPESVHCTVVCMHGLALVWALPLARKSSAGIPALTLTPIKGYSMPANTHGVAVSLATENGDLG